VRWCVACGIYWDYGFGGTIFSKTLGQPHWCGSDPDFCCFDVCAVDRGNKMSKRGCLGMASYRNHDISWPDTMDMEWKTPSVPNGMFIVKGWICGIFWKDIWTSWYTCSGDFQKDPSWKMASDIHQYVALRQESLWVSPDINFLSFNSNCDVVSCWWRLMEDKVKEPTAPIDGG
jgi:hypothetical protein